MRRLALAGLAACIAAPAAAQPIEFTAVPALGDRDTVASAQLSAEEFAAIVRQVEETSFDTPDYWESELRVRRVRLGKDEGLIVRGSDLLCGGTGNCQTWIFRRESEDWTDLFDGQAPTVSSVGFAREAHHELPDLVATAHLSAAVTSYLVYAFDGKVYRAGRCYSATEGQRIKPAPCR